MKTSVTFLLQLIVLHSMFENAEGNENLSWEYFHRPGNIAILGDKFRTEDKIVSRLDCVSRCISCPAVAFREDTKECRHYTGQNHTVVPVLGQASDPGLWIGKQMTLIAAQAADSSLMTHAEADNLCRVLGGRLAKYRELLDAKKDGFHLCSCGWLDDETARFVLYYDDPVCEYQQMPVSTPGLHTCKIVNADGQRVYETHYRAAYCKYTI